MVLLIISCFVQCFVLYLIYKYITKKNTTIKNEVDDSPRQYTKILYYDGWDCDPCSTPIPTKTFICKPSEYEYYSRVYQL